ncbi:MAG TPA: transposase [Kofleriaceae bacterium]|jgi:putative transposase
MGRYRKIHIQQSLLNLAGTTIRDPRGGKRKGAGRPPKNGRRKTPHRRRPAFRASQPVHVSIKFLDSVVKTVDGFRKMDLYRALRKALVTTGRREDMRIVHMSIQDSHLHLIIEADGKTALSRGIQGFKISAAKWINRAIWERGGSVGTLRKGTVFAERYFNEVITSPRQARNALSYVLNNWRRHRLDRGEGTYKLIDKFSSALKFDGWKDFDRQQWSIPRDYEPLVVWEARTWLLREGWRRHGLISVYERPGHGLNAATKRRLAKQGRTG